MGTPYPRDIVPCNGWRKGILASEITACNLHAIIGHWLEGPKENFIDDSLGEGMIALSTDALPIERIPNLSCSLMGALFLFEHFHFRQVKDGKNPWDGDTNIPDSMLNEENFIYMPEVTVIGWEINSLENRDLPYRRAFSKKSEYDKVKQMSAEIGRKRGICTSYLKGWEDMTNNTENGKQRIADLKGKCHIIHNPTNMNFWHFTIDIFPADKEEPMKSVSAAWQKNIASYLADYLQRAFIHITEATDIPGISNNIWEKP